MKCKKTLSLLKYRVFGYDGPKYLCYFYFITWQHVSLGLHVHLGAPNIEIHLPFGFIRVGWQLDPQQEV